MLETASPTRRRTIGEVALLVMLFFAYAGDHPPMVNEAHYLVKAKNFWQPDWCQRDLFVASGKAHTTFYFFFGWPTRLVSLAATAWLGRLAGWTLLAIGLQRLSWRLLPYPFVSLGVAAIWIAGIEYGDLAGEWVVGGIEAKVPAYGFVLLALAELVERRWNRVWPLLGLASAFHVLSGGWSVVAAMLVWLATELKRSDRQPFFSAGLFLGGAISLFGLLPAIWLTLGTSGADAAFAARVYTYFRLKHHLLPADLQTTWYVRHGALILATLVAFFVGRKSFDADKWSRIGWFTVGAVAIAATGLAIGALPAYAPELAAKLLRYYWFRLTDAVVPLTFGLLVMRLMLQPEGGTGRRIISIAILATAVGLIAHSGFERARSGVPTSASSSLLGYGRAAVDQSLARLARTLRDDAAATQQLAGNGNANGGQDAGSILRQQIERYPSVVGELDSLRNVIKSDAIGQDDKTKAGRERIRRDQQALAILSDHPESIRRALQQAMSDDARQRQTGMVQLARRQTELADQLDKLTPRFRDFQRVADQMAFRDWLAVCDWVRIATPTDEVFLTPRHQQTFKWYAQRAEVVNWKDVPQDAASLKKWFHRFKDVFPPRLGTVRVTIRYDELRRYREQYGVRFMIVDRRMTGPNLPLAKIYPLGNEINRTYAVYELPY